jgi:hypothetical protein
LRTSFFSSCANSSSLRSLSCSISPWISLTALSGTVSRWSVSSLKSVVSLMIERGLEVVKCRVVELLVREARDERAARGGLK